MTIISWVCPGSYICGPGTPIWLVFCPKIFNAVADFIAWVLHQHGIAHQLHYLDDFLFLGALYSNEAATALETVLRVLRMLRIPVAVHKTEGPATSLIFLGIMIDTHTFELHLPEQKLARLQGQLHSWVTRKHCHKHELESLLGHQSHAATVVRHGRTFLRQLFPLLPRARGDHHFIHLSWCPCRPPVVENFSSGLEWSVLLPTGYPLH